MSVTRTGARASPFAAYSPPKPPPTITTCGTSDRRPLVVGGISSLFVAITSKYPSSREFCGDLKRRRTAGRSRGLTRLLFYPLMDFDEFSELRSGEFVT